MPRQHLDRALRCAACLTPALPADVVPRRCWSVLLQLSPLVMGPMTRRVRFGTGDSLIQEAYFNLLEYVGRGMSHRVSLTNVAGAKEEFYFDQSPQPSTARVFVVANFRVAHMLYAHCPRALVAAIHISKQQLAHRQLQPACTCRLTGFLGAKNHCGRSAARA
jgi:hypothetical protein